MNNTGKWVGGVVVVIALIAIVVFAMRSGKSDSTDTNATSTEKSTIKIGLSLPLTGDLAFIGETDRNAAQLALEEVNKQEGLKHNYELVFEDDSFNAAKAASVIKKFTSIDKVDAVISIGSTAGNVVAPVAETNRIPHIGAGASDSTIAKGDYNFIHWTRPQEEADAMLKELQKRKITKVAALVANQQGLQAMNTELKNKAGAVGITITDETFNLGQTDFRTTISKIEKEKPEIYLLGAFDPEVGIIAKQIRELGIKTPLTSIESFALTADLKPFEGQWFVDAAVPTSQFGGTYQQKYGKEPGPAAANTYDAIHLLVKAFEAVPGDGKPASDQVAKALGGTQGYSGALGPLSVNSDGIFISQAAIKIVKDGKAVAVQE